MRVRPSKAWLPRTRSPKDAQARPGQCLPTKGAVAARTDGALVLFAVGQDFLGERPVALEVSGARVILDV